MEITNQHLIDAAKAIGINAYEDPKYPKQRVLLVNDFGGFDDWNPLEDKSQIMDLYFKLKFCVAFDYDGGGSVISHKFKGAFDFDNTFESFAKAIVLAAAEYGSKL